MDGFPPVQEKKNLAARIRGMPSANDYNISVVKSELVT